jgi:hypothetical protein
MFSNFDLETIRDVFETCKKDANKTTACLLEIEGYSGDENCDTTPGEFPIPEEQEVLNSLLYKTFTNLSREEIDKILTETNGEALEVIKR